ncbi:MAG: response regulator [Bacteroidota bacterium]
MDTHKVLIVEDELPIAESLEEILDLLGHDVFGTAASYDEAIELMKSKEMDIILLDIQLKGDKNGLDVAQVINDEFRLPYIFTTAFADENTIKQASDLSPFGYLVKPYALKDINPAIKIALSNHKNADKMQSDQADFMSNNHLYIKVNSKLVRLNDDDILYIESKGDYALFKTLDKGFIVHSTIKNVSEKMNPSKFLKVHRSYVINLDKIKDIEDSSILIEGKVIPVSRQHKKNLMDRIDLL